MNQNNPKISVIVPIYNTEKYLRACLKSISQQTYENLEVILIDDGSTDNSSQIARDFAKKDPRFKYFYQKNAGLSSARNTGLKKSTGEYITFVDSDDTIEPNMIHDMLNALYNTSADIVVCSFKEIYPNHKIVHFSKDPAQKIYDTESALSAMLKEQDFMLSATMKLFPKKYFKNISFPIGKLHEDVGTTYKLIMKANRMVFVPKEYYSYHHHENSIIATKFDNRKFDIIELTDQMCDDIKKIYPNLKNITNERRMRARFSILRQIPANHEKTKTIIKYLRIHQDYIFKNPDATIADKVALSLALTNIKLFQLAYRLKKP